MEHSTVGMSAQFMDTDHQRIHRILEEQFQAAVKRRDIAAACFDEIRKVVPSGLPQPDGTQLIANASSEYSAALSALSRAALRVTNFQVSGIIPEDLKEDHPQCR